MRGACLLRAAVLPLALALLAQSCQQGYQRHEAHIVGPFDTITILLGYAQSERAFNRYAEIAFARMEALHKMFDIFNAHDGISNLHAVNANAGIAPVEVGQEIIGLLLAAREAYDITGGKTNAAMGSVLRIWHESRMRGLADPESAALPPIASLREAAGRTDMSDVVIDAERRTVFLRERGMSLDVGSLAKGYAARLALAAAEEAGLQTALLSAGGHIVALGAPPGRGHWNIAVQNPERGAEGAQRPLDILALTDAAVSVSGSHQRFYVVDGKALGHIIDPETLMPANLHRQVAVVHPQSWMADALSTALFILPPREGMALAAAAGAEALWIDMNGGWLATPGYARLSSMFEF